MDAALRSGVADALTARGFDAQRIELPGGVPHQRVRNSGGRLCDGQHEAGRRFPTPLARAAHRQPGKRI